MSRQLQYDKESLQNAVMAVKSKSMGYLKASRVYKVPRSTIFDKVHEKSSMNCSMGPHTVLSSLEEERLATWLVDMSKIGYGRTRSELLNTVSNIIKADGRPTPFKQDVPGKDWYYGFMRRHPEISLRSPRQLGKERAVISQQRVEKWFDDFEQFIKKTVADDTLLLDPTRIYNADESGFALSAKTGHVLGLRGAKSVYNVCASDRSQITVLCGMSAAAHFLRPMIVFPGQRFSRNMLEGFEDAVLGRSETGWMDSELFTSWLTTVFIPDVEQRQVKKPVILFVDGHKTHLTLEASNICKENNIILYCLLEHGSHLMQPCDLRLFGSLKESWKVALRDWQIRHVGEYVTKFCFAEIFKQAWIASSKVENAVNGFRDAGLFPLNRQQVLKTDKFQTSVLFTQTTNYDLSAETREDIDNTPATEMSMLHEDKDNPDRQKEAPDDKQDRTRNEDNKTDGKEEDICSQKDKEDDRENGNGIGIAEDIAASQMATQESPLTKYLKLPVMKKLEKKKAKRELIPKAVTGEQFRAILLEKKRKREEEEHAKVMRKIERERKKEEKVQEKRKKEEVQQIKKKEREEKKARQQALKKVKRSKHLDDVSDSDSGTDIEKHLADDDGDALMEEFDMCPCCNKGDQHPSMWVNCASCKTRWHFKCANRPEYELLDENERKKLEFICPMCE